MIRTKRKPSILQGIKDTTAAEYSMEGHVRLHIEAFQEELGVCCEAYIVRCLFVVVVKPRRCALTHARCPHLGVVLSRWQEFQTNMFRNAFRALPF